MRIILLGFMGVGKSTIGREVAEMLNWEHLDLDTVIEKKQKCTISEIFKQYGENKFREIERFWLKNISKYNNVVISTGGGTPCYVNNMELLLESGTTIYLKTNPQIIFERLSRNNNDRPLLNKKNKYELKNFIIEELNIREPYYSKAKHTINIGNSTSKEIADKINDLIQ